MATNLTKEAVHAAMRIAEANHDGHAWTALDILFLALVAGEEQALAEAMEEWASAGVGPEHPLPAWATPSDGRRA